MRFVNGYLAFSVFSAVLGMFQFGYNTAVLNGPQKFIEEFIGKDYGFERIKILYGLFVGLFAVGGMTGSFFGSIAADCLGRKLALILNCFIGIAGGLFMAFSKMAWSFELLTIGRLLIGIHCGVATTVAPIYISEISPIRLRGGLGIVNQLAVTIGLTISQILGIDAIFGTKKLWPVLLGLTTIPPVLQLVFLPFCYESPRYLLMKKKDGPGAKEALNRLRHSTDTQAEIQELNKEAEIESGEGSVSKYALLTSRQFRRPLIVGVVMHLSQQLSGINSVLGYSTLIFIRFGVQEHVARQATIGVGATMILMALVSMPLMDRAGRRVLHLGGLLGMLVCCLLMIFGDLLSSEATWISIFGIIVTFLYVGSFGVGPGSIPWMIMPEMFQQRQRSAAVGIGATINWIANFLVISTFPSIEGKLGKFRFVPFACLIFIFLIFLSFKMPETKKKTVEEIVSSLK